MEKIMQMFCGWQNSESSIWNEVVFDQQPVY